MAPMWPFRKIRSGLPPEVDEAVRRWKAAREPEPARPVGAGRWVVVDVETSGLDARRDELIAVGGLAVVDGAIDLADSFEVVLRQRAPSDAANIEVHGIGGEEQAGGEDPARALAAFLDFAGKDPLVAFHAPFDRTMITRALESHLGLAFRRPWADLADLAPLAWPQYASRLDGLDAWLEQFAIPVAHRHRAIADCLATAQLLLMVLREAPVMGARNAGQLVALCGESRWLA